jgi:hypothetical protein
MADPLQPGSVFAGHRIEGLAGKGGMGVVYRATHIALDHVVALKVISPALAEDERFRRRFGEESRIAVSIRHPNVVAIHHAGEEGGLLFVTMDLIDGTDLRGLLHVHGRMDPEHAAAVVTEVAAALDAAHAKGLVHRDIKPGNILIEGEGPGERVFLTDFGLARLVEASTGVTATGAFVGTLDYVAPEQIRGERVDARADVYALGCVLFELLTGNPPFAARDDKVAKMFAHLQEEPPRVRLTRPELPAELDLVVGRALAKDPAERYPSAGDFARAVTGALQGQPTLEAERSVGTGAAAPGPPEATTSAQREPAETAEGPTGPATVPGPSRAETEAVPAAASHRSRARGPWIALAAGVVAVIVAAALLLGGGDDGTDAGGQTTAGQGTQPDASAPEAAIDGDPVPVGRLPVNLAHGEDGLWVTNRVGRSISFVDGDPAQEIAEIPLDGKPEGIAVGEGSIWVSTARGELLRLDPDGTTVARIQVGAAPGEVAFGEGAIWVAVGGEDTLAKVDPGTNSIVDTVEVGDEPYGLTLGDGFVWVTNRKGNSVSRVTPINGRVDGTIEVGRNPKGISFGDGATWVANTDDGTVSKIVGGMAETTIEVGPEPRGIVFAFGSVWVASALAGEVTRIDPATDEVAEELPAGSSPEGITAGPKSVWVANGGSNDLTRIDPGVD